jgi:hypothetical protein
VRGVGREAGWIVVVGGRGVADFGDAADVVKGVRDLFDGDEGEDA